MTEILTNKNFKAYDYTCRYTPYPFYFNNLDQKYIYATTSQLIDDNTYVLHTIRRNDTLDSLALTYYNSPLYFWVIADFNKIQDPLAQLKEGDTLKIPTLSNIRFEED